MAAPGQAFGLYSHMRNNRIRSGMLLAGLFLLAYLATFGMLLVGFGFADSGPGADPFAQAWRALWAWFPVVTAVTALWIFIGFRLNVALIGAVTGAKGITPTEAPKLYRTLETLCISRGLAVPKLAIVESEALNAFASGVNDKQFTVSVTRGLLDNLDDAEIEAVLAHELTHIRNGDVRLMVIAVVIAGVISFVGEVMFRGTARGNIRLSGGGGGNRKGNGAAILIGLAIIALAWFLAVIVRLSLSRSREYLADAGAVELTKNPDAMISALLKIAGRADLDGVPSGVMDMCFENDPDDMGDLFATHPSITKRVQALVEMAGGRMPDMPPHPPKIGARQDLPRMVEDRGPWGPRPTG